MSCLVWKAGAVFLLFNCWFTSAILNKWTVSESRKFHVMIYVEKATVLRSNFMFCPCWVRKYYEWFLEVLWLSPKSFIVIYQKCWQTNLGYVWLSSCYQNTLSLHKNALWVFCFGNFVVESLLFAQRLWILNLFLANTEVWAPWFDWLKDYNFWTFQTLFILSQNPVTSSRELYCLLPAIMLSLFILS